MTDPAQEPQAMNGAPRTNGSAEIEPRSAPKRQIILTDSASEGSQVRFANIVKLTPSNGSLLLEFAFLHPDQVKGKGQSDKPIPAQRIVSVALAPEAVRALVGQLGRLRLQSSQQELEKMIGASVQK